MLKSIGAYNPANVGAAFTDNSGAPGNTTINTPRGRGAFTGASSTVTVTSNLVTPNSSIFVVLSTNDATGLLKNVVAGAGSFVITLNAATTGICNFDFLVVN